MTFGAIVAELPFALGLLAIVLMAAGVARYAGVPLGLSLLTALARAAVQLAIIALLLRGVLEFPLTIFAFLALMLTTASLTAASRIRSLHRGRTIALIAVLAGASVAVVASLALGLVPLKVANIIAISGIIIGNAMSSATEAGRRFAYDALERRDEVEGWLALGATAAQAHLDVGRRAVREAMLPRVDQTRSTGLVTLPGAFVGALFGGASPIDAARFQLAVLAGVLLCMIISAVVVTRLAGRSPFVCVAAP